MTIALKCKHSIVEVKQKIVVNINIKTGIVEQFFKSVSLSFSVYMLSTVNTIPLLLQ